MNELMPFVFETHSIRVVMMNGDPWWVAADVCAALEIGNTSMALGRLDDDEKGISSTDTLGGQQEMAVINEPGLYSLILGSRKPEAKAFKRWVTHEVIPTIRKTGRYEAKPAELTREQILVMALESERERLRLAAELEAAQPMIQFHDEIAQGGGEFTIRETVKALFNRAITEQQLSGWLRQQGWLCQSSREPTAWAMDRNLMRLRTEYLPACGKTILVPVLTGHGFTLLRHLYRTGELFTAGISADRLLAAPRQAV